MKTLVYVFITIAAFLAGFWWSDHAWQAKWSDYQAEVARKSQEEISKAWQSEKNWQEAADVAARQGLADYDEINRKYQDALERIRVMSADRLRNAEPARSGNVPQSAGTSCRPCPACPSESRGSYVRADQALKIARDCDVVASKFNRLLKLYQSVKTIQ